MELLFSGYSVSPHQIRPLSTGSREVSYLASPCRCHDRWTFRQRRLDVEIIIPSSLRSCSRLFTVSLLYCYLCHFGRRDLQYSIAISVLRMRPTIDIHPHSPSFAWFILNDPRELDNTCGVSCSQGKTPQLSRWPHSMTKFEHTNALYRRLTKRKCTHYSKSDDALLCLYN